MDLVSLLRRRVSLTLLILVVVLFVAGLARLPEFVFVPALSPGDRAGVHVLLPDDMMITMRVAKFFLAHGYPGFNVSDLSQPATSYVLPIVVAPLFALFADNIALVLVSALGVLAFSLTAAIIVRAAPERRRLPLLLLLFLNSSVLAFLFTGWEHMWQALFVVLAWACAWREQAAARWTPARGVAIGLCAALAVLFRVDAVLLVGPLLAWIFFFRRGVERILPGAVFVVIVALYMAVQWHWFGTLTPTTARLKAGTLPSLAYDLRYWLSCIKSGSAAALVPLLLVMVWPALRAFRSLAAFALLAVLVSYAYACLVSDVFPYGRMFIAPLMLLALVVAQRPAETPEQEATLFGRHRFVRGAAVVLIGLALLALQKDQMVQRIKRPLGGGFTPISEQLVLARYLRGHIAPGDGAIGQFWLGTVGFYLPDYEVADLLGKADEAVARGAPKWGPPGHNKWNTELSLDKWRPAVVPFFEEYARMPAQAKVEMLEQRRNYAFWADYDAALQRRGYVFCKPYPHFRFGLYIRSDLLRRFPDCAPLATQR